MRGTIPSPFSTHLDQQVRESGAHPFFKYTTHLIKVADPASGLPKPITITHGSVAAQDNDHNLPVPAGRKKLDSTLFTLDGDNRRLYLVLPFFHVSRLPQVHAVLDIAMQS
jgi:hypothetical protein